MHEAIKITKLHFLYICLKSEISSKTDINNCHINNQKKIFTSYTIRYEIFPSIIKLSLYIKICILK